MYVLNLLGFSFFWTFSALFFVGLVHYTNDFQISYLVIVMFYQICIFVWCIFINPDSPLRIIQLHKTIVERNSSSGYDSRYLEVSAIEVPDAQPGAIVSIREPHYQSGPDHTNSQPSAPSLLAVVIEGEL